MRNVLIALLTISSFACASTDRWLRPPTMTEPPLALDNVPIKTKCADPKNCIYYTVELTAAPTTPDGRDQVTDYLRFIADRNCETFMSRAFANRSGAEATRNVAKDLSTGLAAGTAYALPAVSVGFGFANLLGGTVVDNVNATYYLKETFPALKSAIATARERQLASIATKRTTDDGTPTSLTKYPFWQAVDDIEHYAHLCSFDAAVSELNAHAATAQVTATNERIKTENNLLKRQTPLNQ